MRLRYLRPISGFLNSRRAALLYNTIVFKIQLEHEHCKRKVMQYEVRGPPARKDGDPGDRDEEALKGVLRRRRAAPESPARVRRRGKVLSCPAVIPVV